MRRLPRRPASCARSTVAEAIKVLEDAGPLRAPEPGQRADTSEGAATTTPPPNPRRSGGGAGCDLTADQAVSLDSNDPTNDPTNVRTSGPDRRGLRSTLCRRGPIPDDIADLEARYPRSPRKTHANCQGAVRLAAVVWLALNEWFIRRDAS